MKSFEGLCVAPIHRPSHSLGFKTASCESTVAQLTSRFAVYFHDYEMVNQNLIAGLDTITQQFCILVCAKKTQTSSNAPCIYIFSHGVNF